jgi:catechol 2,3-dioxygenase-like lactoylglutathione lyase family enzyme
MINGLHAMIFSDDAAADRAFLRDVLGFPYVDSGGEWLIFKMPPAEMGVHPGDGRRQQEVYFMCDDVAGTVTDLRGRGVEIVSEPTEQGYGVVAAFRLPGGGVIEIYEPKHPKATDLP